MLCRGTRLWHGSDLNAVLLPCQTKLIYYINVFWRDFVPAGKNCYVVSGNPEFGTTLARRLNPKSFFCRAKVEPNCNYVRHGKKHDV